jgi:hypothetical protein
MPYVSYKRHGKLRFLKIWRLSISWTITREYKSFKPARKSVERIPDRLVLDMA